MTARKVFAESSQDLNQGMYTTSLSDACKRRVDVSGPEGKGKCLARQGTQLPGLSANVGGGLELHSTIDPLVILIATTLG
jgi:hypothetical protein